MLTIALAQLKSSFMNKQENLEKAISVMKQCKQKAVDLIVFPEMFLTGYALKERATEMAEPLNGPSLSGLCQAARENEIGIVIGFPEKKIPNILMQQLLSKRMERYKEYIGKFIYSNGRKIFLRRGMKAPCLPWRMEKSH